MRSEPSSYKKRELGQRVKLIVGNQFGKGLEHGSRGIAIVRSHYQETSSSRLEKT
jgi:hypothetical protein